MKRQILALALLAAVGVNAQEFNKWSIDLNGGLNKPTIGFTSGYSTSTPSAWGMNGGVRYMFNNKFGVRLGGGYDSFKEGDDSKPFESNIWNVNLQGVANIGRILEFESWTRTIGLLGHAGAGIGQLNSDNLSDADNIGFFVAGLTPQIRLGNRVTLLFDGSAYFNARQQNAFDTYSQISRRGIQSVTLTGTVGLQVALGKQAVHADWYVKSKDDTALNDRLAKLESDVASAMSQLNGKADKMVDENRNNIPDEIESYLNDKFKDNPSQVANYTSPDIATDLIEKGYVNVYFDFNSSKPQTSSLWAADFVANFLKQNTGRNIEVLGYADEIGGANYNEQLSKKRADSIKQLLVDRGIDAGRITSIGQGEDTTVNKDSKNARQLVRRATFKLK